MKFHPIADIFPMLSTEDMDALAADIQANGLLEPIWIYEGKVLDGRNRWMACEMAGVAPITREYTGDDPVRFVLSLNLHRRHMTLEQRALAATRAATLANHRPTGSAPRGALTQGEAAKALGVSRRSVQRARTIVEDGVPELVNAVELSHIGLREGEKIARAPIGEQSVMLEATKKKPHVSNNSGNNEWYTPKEIIEAARKVMGEIDLDPASCEQANVVVKAVKIYTKNDNGLEQVWRGRVWLNPPYSSGLIEKFADKLATATFSEAIVLVNNATETKWFERMVSVAKCICLPTGRVRFYGPSGEHATPLQGQVLIYVGEKIKDFVNEFSRFGSCWVKP